MRLAAALVLVAACEKEPSPTRAGDGSSHSSAPVIIVTKSEISYQDKLVGSGGSIQVGDLVIPLRDLPPPVRCDLVVAKLQRVVAHVDATFAVLANTKAPVVLGSCLNDAWPEPLKECLMMRTPEDIAEHACDALVSDELAQKLLDRLAPGQQLKAQDFLRR